MRLFRRTPARVARVSASWPSLLLLFVVLVPSVCLLWFVNRAAENEQLAVRQKLVDAYRIHLQFAQERLQAHWTRVADELVEVAERKPGPAVFAQIVRGDLADAAVCFDATGEVVYPGTSRPPAVAPLDSRWRDARALEQYDPRAAAAEYGRLATVGDSPHSTARALQAQARCLVRAGERRAALELLIGPLAAADLRSALDTQGRLLAPDSALMALELLPPEDNEQRRALADRIAIRALDYDDPAMSSAQRRFLLRELARVNTLSGPSATSAERALAAEDLAIRWLANRPESIDDGALHPSGIENVRQLILPGGRLVLLHRTAPLLARLRAAIASPELPADIRIELLQPGADADGALLTLPAGTAMPEWRLALVPLDPHALAANSSARSTSYLWIGGLTVLLVVVLALLTWELLRRQLALTRLRNDLVANVTHELKTPLASMRLFVETLLNSERLDETTTREYLALIAQENLRLSRLIDNFLTFSRIERNKYAYAFASVPAARIAEEAAATVRERFATPGCNFTVTIAPDLPALQADADSLVTALLNLLDNAWKYSGDTKEIALNATVCNGSVVFAVRDNGLGLSPRDAQRIFQRFYQVHRKRSPATGGCGLGLSIVHAIVAAHRGTIRVESQPARGSTFTITLPAAVRTQEND